MPQLSSTAHPFQLPLLAATPRPSRKQKRMMTPNPSSSPGSPQPVGVRFAYCQSIKTEDHQEAYENEVISSIQFNSDGNLLAVGDKGGRIQVYKRDGKAKTTRYDPFVSFQSHHPEFDYLKSIEIEEKITQIKWLPSSTSSVPANYLLSANDRTIKLWRVGDSRKREYWNGIQQVLNPSRLTIPRPLPVTVKPTSKLRKLYKNGHTFHINTLSVNSDEQTFASSDDLRINLWNTERTDTSFVIVDIKPENMENLNEVITTCSFHPNQCNILCYSTSRGSTKLCDLRVSATCDNALKHYREECGYKGFFTEVVGSVADAQFSNSGTSIATRDFMTVKIWDTRKESSSLLTMPVHDFLRPHFTLLFENDLIFDKFSVSWSRDDSKILSGSYHDLFWVGEPILGGDKPGFRSSLFQMSEEYNENKHALRPKRILQKGEKCEDRKDCIKIEDMELNKRVLISQWHPKENIVAVASCNSLSIYNET